MRALLGGDFVILMFVFVGTSLEDLATTNSFLVFEKTWKHASIGYDPYQNNENDENNENFVNYENYNNYAAVRKVLKEGTLSKFCLYNTLEGVLQVYYRCLQDVSFSAEKCTT